MIQIVCRKTGEVVIEVTKESFEQYGLEDGETYMAVDTDQWDKYIPLNETA